MSLEVWLTSAEFALQAGIHEKSAPRILRQALKGRSWAGRHLEVRRTHSKGGRGGLRYEVSLRSLSEALGEPLSDLFCGGGDLVPALQAPTSTTPRRIASSDHRALVATRFAAIERALEHRRGTPSRARAIRDQVANGKHSERTLLRWIALYEAHGMPGLARKRPEDAGRRRVEVSTHFDKAFLAAGYPPDMLVKIGAAIDQRIKDIWASRAEAAGGADVCRRAEFELWKGCQNLGVELPQSAMRLSRRHIERFVEYRIVNIWRNNRKEFDDGQPRIRRNWDGYAPMQRIVADVKHVDVILTRDDGVECWPKIVGFHDAGTGRAFLYPLLLKRGEGVRQEHVIEAFLAMVSDPAWGMPMGLYLDNGPEFGCFEKILSALQLMNGSGGREIIYAKPYNASAKSVENTFKRLDTYLFSSLSGYAGGDRMCKKTQTVGRPPQPYPGTWDDFCGTLTGLLTDFNSRPYRRDKSNASALERFKAKVRQGWRPTIVDARVLDAGYCDRSTAVVDRGILHIRGRRWRAEELDTVANRTTLVVCLPWRKGGQPLAQLSDGTWFGLEEQVQFEGDDIAGAKASARGKARYVKSVKALASSVNHYDPVAATLERARLVAPIVIPGRPDRLGGSAELLALADAQQRAESVSSDRAARAISADSDVIAPPFPI